MINSDARSGLKFRHIFGRFRSPKWAPTWAPKSLKNPTWAPPSRPRDAKGRPEASREPFLGLQGSIWSYFGLILEPFGDDFRTSFGSPGSKFGAILSSFWNRLMVIFEPFYDTTVLSLPRRFFSSLSLPHATMASQVLGVGGCPR